MIEKRLIYNHAEFGFPKRRPEPVNAPEVKPEAPIDQTTITLESSSKTIDGVDFTLNTNNAGAFDDASWENTPEQNKYIQDKSLRDTETVFASPLVANFNFDDVKVDSPKALDNSAAIFLKLGLDIGDMNLVFNNLNRAFEPPLSDDQEFTKLLSIPGPQQRHAALVDYANAQPDAVLKGIAKSYANAYRYFTHLRAMMAQLKEANTMDEKNDKPQEPFYDKASEVVGTVVTDMKNAFRRGDMWEIAKYVGSFAAIFYAYKKAAKPILDIAIDKMTAESPNANKILKKALSGWGVLGVGAGYAAYKFLGDKTGFDKGLADLEDLTKHEHPNAYKNLVEELAKYGNGEVEGDTIALSTNIKIRELIDTYKRSTSIFQEPFVDPLRFESFRNIAVFKGKTQYQLKNNPTYKKMGKDLAKIAQTTEKSWNYRVKTDTNSGFHDVDINSMQKTNGDEIPAGSQKALEMMTVAQYYAALTKYTTQENKTKEKQ